ncbi:hypothetical protein EAI_16183 [Harpegnathos saltator]|uniref:Uncharacterized protein n=1 Tax=Harpegnathos saltator TaxID=610380 RepID=E2B4J4_HARSA|nr:hypothetical protein EAI_16183 [Harpegnathos saltator]
MEGKMEIMRRRKEIKEKGIKVEDDLTWKERKMRWNLEEIEREERGKGRNVWVKYERIQIEGKWWSWDGEEEKLKDSEGETRTMKGEGDKEEKGEGKVREKRGKREEGRAWKVMFWNVARLWNKDKEFWGRIKEWDVVMMMETWVDEKEWEKLRTERKVTEGIQMEGTNSEKKEQKRKSM